MSVRQVDKRIDHIRPRTYAHSRSASSVSSLNGAAGAGNPYATTYRPSSSSSGPHKRRRLSIDGINARLIRLSMHLMRPRVILYCLGSIVGIYLFLELNSALNPPKLSAHVPVPSGTKDLRIKKTKKAKEVLDRRKEVFRPGVLEFHAAEGAGPAGGDGGEGGGEGSGTGGKGGFVGIKRDVGEPDYALLSARQPHEIGCDVPLIGETMEREEIGRLVLVGVFTTPEDYDRREL